MRKQIAAVVATLLLSACATPSQMFADAEVRRLCAIDGGVKVYETVKLPPEKYDQHALRQINTKEYAKASDDFYYEHDVKYLQRGDPEVWRSRFTLIRRRDGKALGESISYTRRGGDSPGPWHPSSFSCPERNESTPDITDLVFSMEN